MLHCVSLPWTATVIIWSSEHVFLDHLEEKLLHIHRDRTPVWAQVLPPLLPCSMILAPHHFFLTCKMIKIMQFNSYGCLKIKWVLTCKNLWMACGQMWALLLFPVFTSSCIMVIYFLPSSLDFIEQQLVIMRDWTVMAFSTRNLVLIT